MPISTRFMAVLLFEAAILATPAVARAQLAEVPQISSARTIYFNNQTNSDAVGANALAELKKWGRFRVVADQKHADLIVLLSLEPYQEPGSANDRTGDLDSGDVSHTPKWNQQKPTRYAYLTVIDPKTGTSLWSANHIWGGLLTGFNSAGERLVKEFEKQTKN